MTNMGEMADFKVFLHNVSFSNQNLNPHEYTFLFTKKLLLTKKILLQISSQSKILTNTKYIQQISPSMI